MKQPEDAVTVDWVGGDLVATKTGNAGGGMLERQYPGRGRKPGQRCGAYRGAVKIDSDNMRDRAATGKSQAEFAALCGISERTLRTWERGELVSNATAQAIKAVMANLRTPRQPARPVAYRCPMTGSTWSGRGLMPLWLRVALRFGGKRLDDFATGA